MIQKELFLAILLMTLLCCKRHSECAGILISEQLNINTENLNYCDLIEASLQKDSDALKKISLLSIYDSAGYEHGSVLVQLLEKVGEDVYTKALKPLSKEEKNKVKSYLEVGIEYGAFNSKYKNLKDSFQKVDNYLNTIQENKKTLLQNTFCDSIGSTLGIVRIEKDKLSSGDKIKILNEDNSVFKTITYSDEKMIFDFRVIKKLEDRYKIVFLGKEKFIQNKAGMLFKNWQDHILENTFSIDFRPFENPIRDEPDGEIILKEKGNNYRIVPLLIEENWIKIRFENFDNQSKKEGWIKWKDQSCLLIELFYFG